VFTEAYNVDMLQGWYLSIDIHYISFHVKFEDESSISVLKTRQFATNIYNCKAKSFWKCQISSKAARPLYFTPHPAYSLCNESRLGAPVHVRVSKLTGTYSKE
jgi:hypothetical protein